MSDAWPVIQSQTETSYTSFQSNCGRLRLVQNSILKELLERSAASRMGKTYGFEAIARSQDMLAEFQTQVPVHRYEDIEAYVQEQLAAKSMLVCDEILFYERTGGSSGGAKTIAFTQHALHLLQQGIEPWLHDLILHRPGISSGPAYWSISPSLNMQEYAENGTPIGADSDLSFLRAEIQLPFAQSLIDLSLIQSANSYEQWQKFTLLSLILHENLALVSIWSPSFLTTLLDSLAHHSAWLLDVLLNARGHGLAEFECLANESINNDTHQRLSKALTRTASEEVTNILWPTLDTISCWTHGPAKGAFKQLRQWFPSTNFQAKGLLATEGVISVPLHDASAPVLAVNSGFYEFMDSNENVSLPEALQIGACYRVLMSNASGLFRYDIGDQVRVTGFHKQTPMLEFVGRAHATSDLVGEKLMDAFVSDCLDAVNVVGILAPNNDHYCLFVDVRASVALNAVEALDAQLCQNPQYKYARDLNQLRLISITRIADLAKEHLEWQRAKGQVLGDIKPAALCTDGEFIAHLLELAT